MGQELHGKALGVIGFGRIGQRLAAMCRDGLHMSIYVFDPFLGAEAVSAWGASYVESLHDLAARVDVLSIHVPLTTETYHLISRDIIRAMKPGAILVNAARGPVVDETALVEALQDGHLSGAGLDVFELEPPDLDHPLFKLDQVVFTPHVASFTQEGRRGMGLSVAEDILRVLRGERPEYMANPEVWTHRRRVRT
jgi:phosphoglycerate dehydrogenase-like enzyme